MRRGEERFYVRRLCFDAAALCMALALSYTESVLPIGAWLPIPGMRPGLANIVITFVFFAVSPKDAAVISFSRVAINGMLFGSPLSVWMSFCGALFAYSALCALYFCKTVRKKLSFIGISVLCAAAHSMGQLLAAGAVAVSWGVISYAPVMLALSCFFGAVNGAILNYLYPAAEKILKKSSCKNEKEKVH